MAPGTANHEKMTEQGKASSSRALICIKAQFETQFVREDFQRWLKEREQKGAPAHA